MEKKKESLSLRLSVSKSLKNNDLDDQVRTEVRSDNAISESKDSEMKKKFCLSDGAGDLKKRWYIRYSVRNKANKVVTKKVYGGINRFKTDAERREAAMELIRHLDKTVKDVYVPQYNASLIATTFHKVLEDIKPTLKRKSYWTYYSKITLFLEWCELKKIKSVGELTPDKAVAFQNYLLTEKRRSNATYNAYRTTLHRVFGQIPHFDSPFSGIKRLAKQSVPAQYFQKFQVASLRKRLEKDEPQLWLFCRWMYYTLIRPGELRVLKIGDIDFENGRILVVGSTSKNKRLDYVTIPDEFFAELMEMRLYEHLPEMLIFGSKGEPSFTARKADHFSKLHTKILKDMRFNTDRYKLYSWKHTGAVGMVTAGIHIKYIQMQGRWKSLDQVNDYLRSLGVEDMGDLKSKHKM